MYTHNEFSLLQTLTSHHSSVALYGQQVQRNMSGTLSPQGYIGHVTQLTGQHLYNVMYEHILERGSWKLFNHVAATEWRKPKLNLGQWEFSVIVHMVQ